MSPKHPKSPFTRPVKPRYLKPPGCLSCSLADRGLGYVPGAGPEHAALLFLGEAPWLDEVARGTPFAGAAGGMLDRLFRLTEINRPSVRIENVLRCAPPGMELEGTPYATSAISVCGQYRDAAIEEWLRGPAPHKVLVPLGATALRWATNLRGKGVNVEYFHGTVTPDPSRRFWIVPTYHPSHLQRGASNLIGTVCFDLLRALEVAESGWADDPGELIADPSIEWFHAWADGYLAALAADPCTYLAVDIETPDTRGVDETALGPDSPSYEIKRINFSCHPDEGLSVPYVEPYRSVIRRVLAAGGVQLYWYKGYDEPRLRAAGEHLDPNRCWDLMWIWKAVQSDLPMSLGFCAPFYSTFGPWKHLADLDPAQYGAGDGLQTCRVGHGLIADAVRLGLWRAFERHMHRYELIVLRPAMEVGIGIDRQRLEAFQHDLETKASGFVDALQGCVPPELLPRAPKQGLTSRPESAYHKARTETLDGRPFADVPDAVKLALYQRATLVEERVTRDVHVCHTCGAEEVVRKHRCKDAKGRPDKTREPAVALESRTVTRWFWQEPFNPDSWQQVLAYIELRGHQPGRAKKTGKPSTDRKALKRLRASTGDPFYGHVLQYRAVNKILGTYVKGTLRRLDPNDRLHPVPTFRPSTGRQSYIKPNIQNVVADKDKSEALASGFRHSVVALPSTRLLEVDFSGIEAVDVGWFARDPDYIRLAKLGVHAGLASHVLGTPYDPRWVKERPADLVAFFREIKKKEPLVYDRAKRCVHGDNYMLTEYGMVENFPETYPDLKTARRFKAVYREMAPNIPKWQAAVVRMADQFNFLGGAFDPRGADDDLTYPFVHPFQWKHWFWSVYAYRTASVSEYLRAQARAEKLGTSSGMVDIGGRYYRVTLGEDGKRSVAFYPQSTARFTLSEALFELLDPESAQYIVERGLATPFRAPIHDSGLFEIKTRRWDSSVEAICTAFQRPVEELPCPPEWEMGPYLSIGIEAKAGHDWGSMETIELPAPPTMAGDLTSSYPEGADDEEDQDEFKEELRWASD